MRTIYTYTIPKYQVGDIVRADVGWPIVMEVLSIHTGYNIYNTYPDVIYQCVNIGPSGGLAWLINQRSMLWKLPNYIDGT